MAKGSLSMGNCTCNGGFLSNVPDLSLCSLSHTWMLMALDFFCSPQAYLLALLFWGCPGFVVSSYRWRRLDADPPGGLRWCWRAS